MRASRRRQVVHFDRLKPYPQNIQTQVKPDVPRQQATVAGTPKQSRPPPPGTVLQLVEDYEDTEPQGEQDPSNILAHQGERRYPLRSNRRRPARYGDE